MFSFTVTITTTTQRTIDVDGYVVNVFEDRENIAR
jgi:hypothetical protein